MSSTLASARALRAQIFLLALVVLLGGTTSATAGPKDVGGQRDVTVMTRNLYFGASLDELLLAQNLGEVLYQVELIWAGVQLTDFNVRAKALADEIVEAQPDLIGLQEVALWRTQFPSDTFSGAPTPATDVAYDFLQILLDELASRGAHYSVVVSIDNLDTELPVLSTFQDVRLTDRDVILARADLPHGYLQVLDTDAGHFDVLLTLPVGGAIPVTVYRGWVAADVKVRGKAFRLVNAHLEDDPAAPIQEFQAWELLLGPTNVDQPVILLGDFNSDTIGTGTDSYEILLSGGFEDAWTDLYAVDSGPTWGHDPDLLNPTPMLTERIDLILYRGNFTLKSIDIVGDEDGDQAPGGLWPSDHAGVVATFAIKGQFK
jgi:endonuclease/exonuclease/phosphatase family metal-dependent hydrolase